MTLTDYDFFQKLREGKINCSKIPKSILNANYFKNLYDSKIIILKGNWKRGNIEIGDQESFDKFFKNSFPNDSLETERNRANNIKLLRNSKATATQSNFIVFLRGKGNIKVNDIEIDLDFHTKKFGCFAVSLDSFSCDKICFVENLYAFMNIEKSITEDYVFLHTYGRVGKQLLEKIEAKEVLVFSDYDFVGLSEYLKFKIRFANTTFFIPSNYDYLFDKYSKPLKDTNKETSQKPDKQVIKSNDETVVRIRKQIYETSYFLEQEIVIVYNL